MKRTYKRILVRALLIMGTFFGVYKVYISQRCVEQCAMVIDALCDPALSHEIMTFARAHSHLPIDALSELLKTTYPSIEHVSLTRCPGEIIGDIHIAKPLLNVNDRYFVCTNGQLYEQKFFNKQLTHALPRITIDENALDSQARSPQFLSWATHASPTFLRNYAVTWRSPVEIIVSDPRDAHIRFIVDVHTQLNTAFLLHGYRSKQLAIEQGKISKNGWVVDMRFAQQIVLYPGCKGA